MKNHFNKIRDILFLCMLGVLRLQAHAPRAIPLGCCIEVTHETPLFDAPLEKHFFHYSRGQVIDLIKSGERLSVQNERTIPSAMGPQTWLKVARQTTTNSVGWIDGADLDQNSIARHSNSGPPGQ